MVHTGSSLLLEGCCQWGTSGASNQGLQPKKGMQPYPALGGGQHGWDEEWVEWSSGVGEAAAAPSPPPASVIWVFSGFLLVPSMVGAPG